jgi:hypothetical protein
VTDPDDIAETRRALGRQLSAFRRAAGHTQANFAPLVGYSRSMVANVETGRENAPVGFWRSSDQILGTGGRLVAGYTEIEAAVRRRNDEAARAAEADREAKAHWWRTCRLDKPGGGGPDWRLLRRWDTSTGKQSATAEVGHADITNAQPGLDAARCLAQGSYGPQVAPSLMSSGGHDLFQVELVRRHLHGAISGDAASQASLDDWEETVRRHGEATRYQPAPVTLTDLSSDLIDLHDALRRCRSTSSMRQLARITAQMAGLMCLTMVKLGARTAFRSWARTARIAAREAGDPLTFSWIRAQEAYGYYYSGEVARHAQALGGRTLSVGAVLAAALEARAHAALDVRSARETAATLGRAESLLSQLDRKAVTASAFGYSEAQLRFHAGNAYTHLHNSEAVWRNQEAALALYPDSDYLDRALTKLDYAHCLAYDGDVTGAMAYAVDVLTGLTRQQQTGIIAARAGQALEVVPVRQQAVPSVTALRELLMERGVTDEMEPPRCG